MSRFSRDSPGLKALSRRPGQLTKMSRLEIQSSSVALLTRILAGCDWSV